MKHTFQWLLAAVCLFVVGNAQVMADDEEVKIMPYFSSLRCGS